MTQSPRRTRGSPSGTLFDTLGAVSIAVGTRVDVSIDGVDPSNHPTSGASSARSSSTHASSEAPLPGTPPKLLNTVTNKGVSTAEVASALVNSYYRFANPSIVVAKDESPLNLESRRAGFAHAGKLGYVMREDLLTTSISNKLANEVVAITAPSATTASPIPPMSTGVVNVAVNAASTLNIRNSSVLQPSIAPLASVPLSEPIWLAATVVRHRTEIDTWTGLEVVSGYDVVFEEQSTVRSSENEPWAHGELDVCPKRLRSPSILPKAADRATANAAGSCTAPVRTRVTRGSAAAGSALPGTRVVVDYGDDGLDLGIVGDVIRSAPGCFMVSFTDGTEEQFQWFEIAKCQSERPPTETGYLIPLESNYASKEETPDEHKGSISGDDTHALKKHSSTLYGWKKESSRQLGAVNASRKKRLSQEEEFERLEMIAAAAARGDIDWVPPWLQNDANNDDEALTDDEASTVHTVATSAKTTFSVEEETTADIAVEMDTEEIDEWVQCEACEKWRRLPSGVQVDADKWFCAMNHWSPNMASCDATEESFSAASSSLRPQASVSAEAIPALLKPSPESDDTTAPAAVSDETRSEVLDEWVQCDACSKWRKVKKGEVNSSGVWVCTLNSDPLHQRCDAPEESWDSHEWNDKQMEDSIGELNSKDDGQANEIMTTDVTDSLGLSEVMEEVQACNRSTDIVDKKIMTWEEEFQLLEASAKSRKDTTTRSRRAATDRKPSEDESSSSNESTRWKCTECAVINTARTSACFRCGHTRSDDLIKAAVAKKESERAALAAAKAAYQARRREQHALQNDGRMWDHAIGVFSAHGGDVKRPRWSRKMSLFEEKEPEEIDDEDDIDTTEDVVAVGKRQREDLVVSFSLFDSGGTAYPYYRLCALRGVAALADGLPTCGVGVESTSSLNDENDSEATNSSTEVRRVRFVVHCDHLVDDSTLVALSAAARGQLTAVRYTTTSRQYSKTCWLISAMRYRTLWETKSNETAVSLDIHDDSAMQLKLIARLENRLDDEHKQVGFTYWRASGKECENGSALPVRLGVGGAHAHTDGGLLLWRSDEHTTSRPKSTSSNEGRVPIEASGIVHENGRRVDTTGQKADGSTPGARRAVIENAGKDFVAFVEESMQACNHDKIRGCDEMLLDGYLHELVGPEHALWQKHAHAIRATPGTHKKEATRGSSHPRQGRSAAGDSRDLKKGTAPTNASLVVVWVHLAVGDGKTGPSILCCPEEHPRKKHRVAPSDRSPRSAGHSKESKSRNGPCYVL